VALAIQRQQLLTHDLHKGWQGWDSSTTVSHLPMSQSEQDSSHTGSGECAEPPASQANEGAREKAVAVRNAMKLALSLAATWTVALAVKFQLPRYLGPARFGQYSFSESCSAAFVCFLGFGVDLYIQREVATRPKHASDFFGGVVMLRALLIVPVFVLMGLTRYAAGSTLELQVLLATFGVAQVITITNETLAAMLQASTRVNALATVNVAAKLTWGAGVLVAVFMGSPLVVLVVPSVVSELLRLVVLSRSARKEVGLQFRIDYHATRKVLTASLPYYVNAVSIVLITRLDVTTLEFLAPEREVGFYGAAANLASLAMMLAPLFTWVMLPLFARVQNRSDEEFYGILRRAIQGFLVVAVPITLFLALGADLWIRLAFSHRFAPAATSLRFLAPSFVGTYLAMLLSVALITVRRSWQLTWISVTGMLFQPLLAIILVPRLSGLGTGWAGAGSALGVSGAELLVSLLLLRVIGTKAIDRRCIVAFVKSLVVAALVVVAHLALYSIGYLRLVVDLLLYCILGLTLGAFRVSDVRGAVAAVLAARHKRAETSGT